MPYYGGFNNNRDYGTQGNTKVDVYIQFKNDEDNGLGMPLPAGRLRVNQEDADDGSLEFIGEDIIGHTPRNEELTLKLGSAFDVVGERKQVDFEVNNARKELTETIEVEIRNQKDDGVEVIVKESLYRGANWQIIDKTVDFEKENANTVFFPVKVKGEGTKKIRYTVKYSWR